MVNGLEALEHTRKTTISNFLLKGTGEILDTIDKIISKAGSDRDDEHKNHFKENYSKFLEKIQKIKDPDVLKKMYTILDSIKNKIPLNHDQVMLLNQYDLKNREDVSFMDSLVFDSNYEGYYLPEIKSKTINTVNENNVFYGSVERNTFGSKVSHNTFSDEVSYNKFNNLVLQNKFSKVIKYNTFNASVIDNTFSDVVKGNYFLQETAEQIWEGNNFQDSNMNFQEFKKSNIFKDKKTF